MELSLDLAVQIASMVLICLAGYCLSRFRIVSAAESRALSVLAVYVFAPAIIIQSFQSELNHDQLSGLALSFVAALLIHLLSILSTVILRKCPLHFTREEAGSCIYSNSGNLGVPLICGIASLGPSYVFYTSAYTAVQTMLLWSHGQALMGGDAKPNLKKILLNPCMISCFAGFVIFFGQIEFIAPVQTAMMSLTGALGPCCMLVVGMSLGSSDFGAVFGNYRVYLVSAVRLILFPILAMLILLVLTRVWEHPDLMNIAIVVFICAIGPSASTIAQQAQIFHSPHVAHSSAINVVSTLFCVLTMPLMLLIMQLCMSI